MTVHVRPSAQEDVLNAAGFHVEQEGGLEDRVTDFLEGQIIELGSIGGLNPFRRGFYRAVVHGAFPYYVIYFSLQLEGVHVRAVIDHRRDPRTIRSRLRKV
jgi:hypothetical protein